MSGSRDKNKSGKYTILNCDRIDGIMAMLDGLHASAQGRVIYQQVEHALRDLTTSQNKITYGYAAILNVILESYRKHLPKQSLLYLEIKLAQRRLTPPITLNELSILHAYMKNVLQLTGPMFEPDEALIRDALRPITGEIESEAMTPELNQVVAAGPASVGVSQDTVTSEPANTAGDVTPSVELRVDSLFRQRLNKHYQEIQALQSDLLAKMQNTSEQHQEFSEVLENALFELEKYSNATEFENVRRNITRLVRTLLHSQASFKHIISDTQSYLTLIGDNSQKLSDELDQVRVLSLTDDLTGLPNRRAFIRRTEDEIVRAERDKTPLTLIAIDLDHFKAINDQYGHTVGDNILRLYASDVLSIFRRYDMVSRYGGEEFAVLLPNTDKEGAMRALLKIQAVASNTCHEYRDEKIPIPSFSAGVVIHRPGETMQMLIDRADKILYRAKQHGRNRIEFDESYSGEISEYLKYE